MIKEIALLTPIYVTLFWGLTFLIQPDKKDKAKQQLGYFMIVVFSLYSCHGIFFNNLFQLYALVEFIYVFAMLAAYPMYFLYLRMISSDKFEANKHLLHFLPALVFSILVGISTLILSPAERLTYVKETLVENNLKDLNLNTFIGIKGFIFLLSRLVLVFQVIYYAIKGIILANQHNKRISDYYSDTVGKTLKWVQFINIIFLIAALSSISLVVLGRSFFTNHEYSLIIPSAIFSSMLFILGHKGNYQMRIKSEFNDETEVNTSESEVNFSTKRLKTELLVLFNKDKIYIKPDLRITHISEQLNTNRTYISKIINDEFNVNFNEFVNKYRVNEAKDLMENPENRLSTLEEIAENSGFGSANSFSRIFKETTGKTPGKYHSQNTSQKK